MVAPLLERLLLRDLRAIRAGRILPSLDIVKMLERRLSVLEVENLTLQRQLAFMRPKKRLTYEQQAFVEHSPEWAGTKVAVDGQVEWRFRVRSWEWVELHVYPREDPEGKVIKALRIHVPLEDVADGPPYWDITRKREIAVLEPVLPRIAGTNTYVHIVQHGDGRTSSYTISFHPA